MENPKVDGLQKLINAVGTKAELARRFSRFDGPVSRQLVDSWMRNGFPPGRCGDAEKIAKSLGLDMTIHDFRPDLFKREIRVDDDL